MRSAHPAIFAFSYYHIMTQSLSTIASDRPTISRFSPESGRIPGNEKVSVTEFVFCYVLSLREAFYGGLPRFGNAFTTPGSFVDKF
jgi:hypothetical protein